MKNRELQSSLIKSGVILVLCIFLIYAFAVTDSGGIGGTIASLFSGVLFFFGLLIAIVLSITVMFGIYFGILYMYDKDTCNATYTEFKTKFIDTSQSFSCCSSLQKTSTKKTVAAPLNEKDLQPLRTSQDQIGKQLNALQASVASIEKTLGTFSTTMTGTTENIARLDEQIINSGEELEGKAATASVEDLSKKLSADVTTIQNSIKPLSEKLTALETTVSALGSADDADSDDAIQEKVDTAISGIKADLASMQKSIDKLASQPVAVAEPASSTVDDDGEHRILSYFTKKNDEKKFVKLVTDAVGKGMTYAQVGEFLNDSLSAEASEVIADHPSLTKDYIRIARQNS